MPSLSKYGRFFITSTAVLGLLLLTPGIVKNHPFVDGNKRTGYEIGGISLEQNKHKLHPAEEEATTAIMVFASSAITEDNFAHWLQANCA